jgi:hypothetical protein
MLNCVLSLLFAAVFVDPTVVHAQYGFGPLISEESGGDSSSDVPLATDQAINLRSAGYILEYSAVGIAMESLFLGALSKLSSL